MRESALDTEDATNNRTRTYTTLINITPFDITHKMHFGVEEQTTLVAGYTCGDTQKCIKHSTRVFFRVHFFCIIANVCEILFLKCNFLDSRIVVVV